MHQQKNVIIAGSTKCGTTSLFEYLSNHPQICASAVKETRFFLDNSYPLIKPKLRSEEVKNYEEFFSNCSPQQWKLEATPDYLYSLGTAEKIKNKLPDCRIIFILRNPEERVVSWFKYGKQRGLISQDCELDEYVELLMKADPIKAPQHLRALEQGRYAHYLKQYFYLFSKENILIIFYSELQNSPATLMNKVCSFLHISEKYFDGFDFKIYNPSLNVKNIERFSKYIKLKKLIRRLNNKLPRNWKFFSKKLLKPLDVFYLKNKTGKWEKTTLSSPNKKFLEEYYKQDNLLLEKLLDKKIIW